VRSAPSTHDQERDDTLRTARICSRWTKFPQAHFDRQPVQQAPAAMKRSGKAPHHPTDVTRDTASDQVSHADGTA